MVVLFYLRKKALPEPSSKDLHMLFISLRAVVQIIVCGPYLAFFIQGKESQYFWYSSFLKKEKSLHGRGWVVQHQVMFQKIPP